MLRRFITLFMCLTLGLTTFACGSSASNYSSSNYPQSGNANNTNSTINPNQVKQGKYPVQQAQFNDANGEYTLMLLNTPAGAPPAFVTTDLQMAQLTDDEVKAGERSYLNLDGGQAVFHLAQDFQIAYVHNVTETQTNPQTGQPQTVVIRQESSFWTPFAGALAGQAVASMLFTPRYYVPPVYQPGGVMRGYGGYGSSYNDAVASYRKTYNTVPVVEKNRQVFRSSGSLRSPSTTTRPTSPTTTRSTGSGFGSSNLKTNPQSRPSYKPRSNGFGSSGSRTKSFGSRRRR
jgi:hypothetical protein